MVPAFYYTSTASAADPAEGQLPRGGGQALGNAPPMGPPRPYPCVGSKRDKQSLCLPGTPGLASRNNSSLWQPAIRVSWLRALTRTSIMDHAAIKCLRPREVVGRQRLRRGNAEVMLEVQVWASKGNTKVKPRQTIFTKISIDHLYPTLFGLASCIHSPARTPGDKA